MLKQRQFVTSLITIHVKTWTSEASPNLFYPDCIQTDFRQTTAKKQKKQKTQKTYEIRCL